jgi:hypothetical protein
MRVASIATYAERLDVLPDAIKSLYNQVDLIKIYYNGKLSADKLEQLKEEVGEFDKVDICECVDRADLSKFNAIWDCPNDTIFLCDDDIIYKGKYCDKLEHNLYHDYMIRADVISCGGKRFYDNEDYHKATRFKDLFATRTPFNAWNSDWEYTNSFHIPLSGVAVIKASQFQKCRINMKYKFAADVQLGKWCKDLGLSVKQAWCFRTPLVKYNPKMGKRETIWDNYTSKDKNLVKLIREIWKFEDLSLL